MLPMEALYSTYLREYGYPLNPQAYEYDNIEELIIRLKDYVKVFV